MDQALRRKDVESSRARELWVEREAQLLLAVESLTEKSKESEAVIRQLQWNLLDAIKEKGNVTEKCVQPIFPIFVEIRIEIFI